MDSFNPTEVPSWLRYGIWAIQQVGFPIAVAGWVMYKLNGRLLALATALTEVAKTFQAVNISLQEHRQWARDESLALHAQLKEMTRHGR